MKTLVINLDNAAERLSFQRDQLKALGVPFERIKACGPQDAGARPAAYWNTWERPLRDAEKACFLSHANAWTMIAAGTEPVLVLEDDAILASSTTAFLATLEQAHDLDLVTLETRGRKKLVARRQSARDKHLGIRRLYQDRTGAAAYVLWPEGARKLLRRTARRAGLADAVICAAYELNAFQADPALAFQADRCALYGVVSPLETRSAISPPGHSANAAPQSGPSSLGFKIRRWRAQIRMGLRQVAKLPLADRRFILPDIKRDFRHLQ